MNLHITVTMPLRRNHWLPVMTYRLYARKPVRTVAKAPAYACVHANVTLRLSQAPGTADQYVMHAYYIQPVHNTYRVHQVANKRAVIQMQPRMFV